MGIQEPVENILEAINLPDYIYTGTMQSFTDVLRSEIISHALQIGKLPCRRDVPQAMTLNVETGLFVIKFQVSISRNLDNQLHLSKAKYCFHHYFDLVGSMYSSNGNFIMILFLCELTY